jgi:hypothetical protein
LQYHAATSVSSASECCVGICEYWGHHMKPTVVILGIHFPGKKDVLTASPADALKKVDIPNSLERYLGRPTDSLFDELAYLEYQSRYSVDDTRILMMLTEMYAILAVSQIQEKKWFSVL